MPGNLLPHLLVSLVAAGMGLAFLLADRSSPTSRALVLTLFAIAASILLNVVIDGIFGFPDWVRGLFAIPEAVAMAAMLEWIRRVGDTVADPRPRERTDERLLRTGQALAVVYALLSLVFPAERETEFLGALSSLQATHVLGFWLFMTPVLGVGLCALLSMARLLRRKPDRPERHRVIAMMAAIPFVSAGFVLPAGLSSVALIIGQMVFLIGALEYHVMQGQRGQFMAQFLSPQVAELVRRRGLDALLREDFIEISCVYVDLRGYTALAERMAASRVMRILRSYYEAVGQVVAAFEATIKDQAGDGVLILVGAPLPVPDHAQRALSLARRLREAMAQRLHEWSQEGIWLGVGIGVASGPVAAGLIGHGARLEYTAAGACVNLAARLCQHAADGEILVSERTVELAGLQAARMGLQVRPPVSFKGFSEPQACFSLAPRG